MDLGKSKIFVEAKVGVGHTTVDPIDPIVLTKKCREWNIPGNRDDYTFTTITSIMSTTLDERI